MESLVTWFQMDFCFDFLADLGPEGARVSKIRFPFFCIICGFFPAVVYVDGNRKTTYSTRNLDFRTLCYRHGFTLRRAH